MTNLASIFAKSYAKRACIAVSMALCLSTAGGQSKAQSATSDAVASTAGRISTDYYVAWWMHDATGYHPAIYMILQNTSSVDLSYKPIKFQCLFRDLKNGYVTVARDEIRKEFHPNQQVLLLLEGPKAFELPIDKNAWPIIECKVMCRVASIDDDAATQDVVVTKLSQEAMTEEEADFEDSRLFPSSYDPGSAKEEPRPHCRITTDGGHSFAVERHRSAREKPEQQRRTTRRRNESFAFVGSLRRAR